MTVTNVRNPQPTRRSLPLQALALGLAAGLLSASVAAGSPSAPGFAPVLVPALAQAASADPAKQVPGVVSVSAVDFKRGDGGAGKLILRFDGEGANPDLRTQGSSVVVNIGNASLPAALQRPLNVSDFATPVQRIDARQGGEGGSVGYSGGGRNSDFGQSGPNDDGGRSGGGRGRDHGRRRRCDLRGMRRHRARKRRTRLRANA